MVLQTTDKSIPNFMMISKPLRNFQKVHHGRSITLAHCNESFKSFTTSLTVSKSALNSGVYNRLIYCEKK
jgi:hypothetical protein